MMNLQQKANSANVKPALKNLKTEVASELVFPIMNRPTRAA